jgi:NDP-sugar pyrophosphorylase family protein
MEPLADITAVVLAGGLGTRLRSAVADRPKVLAPVHGRPFITYLLDRLIDAGVKRAVLCTGYRADMVEETLGPRYRTLELAYSVESSPLGTGGALRLALPHVASDPILVLNGDSFFEADLPAFRAAHAAGGMAASLLLAAVADVARYGAASIDGAGRVTRFVEKGAVSGPGLINAGIYLFAREVLEAIPEGEVSLERDLFPRLIAAGLRGVPGAGRFIDIGIPDDYRAAEAFFSFRTEQSSTEEVPS